MSQKKPVKASAVNAADDDGPVEKSYRVVVKYRPVGYR